MSFNALQKRLREWEEEVERMEIPKPIEVEILERNSKKIEFKVKRNWPAHLAALAYRLNESKVSKKKKMESCLMYQSWEYAERKILRVFHAQAKNIVKEYINWVNEFGK